MKNGVSHEHLFARSSLVFEGQEPLGVLKTRGKQRHVDPPFPPPGVLFQPRLSWRGGLSTYMHLRIKFFCWGGGVGGPDGALVGEVVGAVVGVPGVGAAGPGQLIGEGGDEVVQGPGHDGVVVRGDVERNDADGVANAWERQRRTGGRGERPR